MNYMPVKLLHIFLEVNGPTMLVCTQIINNNAQTRTLILIEFQKTKFCVFI